MSSDESPEIQKGFLIPSILCPTPNAAGAFAL